MATPVFDEHGWFSDESESFFLECDMSLLSLA
jgi:hypothetical protein